MSGIPRWSTPHHDGSATYVSNLAPDLGDTVAVFLRVPRASGVRQALLRVYVDGEQALRETVVDRENADELWLRGEGLRGGDGLGEAEEGEGQGESRGHRGRRLPPGRRARA